MEGYITDTARRDKLAATHDEVLTLARHMGVRLGDIEKPLRQVECALACHMPIKEEDGAMLDEALDFFLTAWRLLY